MDVWYGLRSCLHSPPPDAGSVLKVVVLQKQSSAVTEEVVLEELQVFKVGDAHGNGLEGWHHAVEHQEVEAQGCPWQG